MKWNWRWCLGLSAVVLFLLYDHSPQTFKGAFSWLGHQTGGMSHHRQKLTRSETLGKLKRAEQVALEVKSRLTAVQERCVGYLPDALDAAFLSSDPVEGSLNTHSLRKEWFELRRSVPEWAIKHDEYLTAIRRHMGTLKEESLEEAAELAEESLAWSQNLDEEIYRKTRLLPKFTEIALRLHRERQKAERMNPK